MNQPANTSLPCAMPSEDEVVSAAARCWGPSWKATVDVVVLLGPPADRRVLLIRRRRAPFAGLLALPGGHVEPGESAVLAAMRELAEETNLHPSDLRLVGVYEEPSRDPRLTSSTAFLTQLESPQDIVAGSDANDATWMQLDTLCSSKGALAFDHARILRDALLLCDGKESRYLPRLDQATLAADTRNSFLFLQVNKLIGRSLGGDQDAHLSEYQALKQEAIERIKQRDSFINLNLIAIAGVASFAASSASGIIALLAIPWVALCFGWAYLANDEKVSALSHYIRYSVGPKLSSRYFAWEKSPKRSTDLKPLHKAVQLGVDLLQFVVPGVAAPALFLLTQPQSSAWVVILTILEVGLSLGLGCLFVLHSDFVKKWDIRPDRWTRL